MARRRRGPFGWYWAQGEKFQQRTRKICPELYDALHGRRGFPRPELPAVEPGSTHPLDWRRRRVVQDAQEPSPAERREVTVRQIEGLYRQFRETNKPRLLREAKEQLDAFISDAPGAQRAVLLALVPSHAEIEAAWQEFLAAVPKPQRRSRRNRK